jgi:2-dehydro-3-deoxyphosphogluconate aldolase/(4S)-4-hydroxy-2-oxoglutarate aldolase
VGTVKQTPRRRWLLLDGGITDNLRPALYGARYAALPVRQPRRPEAGQAWLAGPHCESSDVLIEALPLPQIGPGELLAVPVSGAYQLSMSSNYNGACRPAVLWLEDGEARLIQERETPHDLIRRDKGILSREMFEKGTRKMSHFSRLEVLNTMIQTGLVPVFYHSDVQVAQEVVRACAAGGARTIEFTNRGDFAPEVFKALSQFAKREIPDVILGVGSVIDAPTAALYIAYGANFVVGPVLNAEVARLCNRRKVAYSPGCGSASEISYAEELGVEIVKVFPGSAVGGPGFVRAVLGPCPWTRIMPTGGVDATEESIKAWFEAGVACVGIGSKLVRKDLIAAGDFAEITRLVRQVLGWISEAR